MNAATLGILEAFGKIFLCCRILSNAAYKTKQVSGKS